MHKQGRSHWGGARGGGGGWGGAWPPHFNFQTKNGPKALFFGQFKAAFHFF